MDHCKTVSSASFLLIPVTLGLMGFMNQEWVPAIGLSVGLAINGVLFMAIDKGLTLLQQVVNELHRANSNR
jgi:hypothetical protein